VACRETVVSCRFPVHSWRLADDHCELSTGHWPPSTGFTLIEMLVALAIMSTIVTMVYGSYAATSRSLDIYNSRMACSERACLVLRLMARQLRCAYAPSPETGSTQSSPQNSTPSTQPDAFRADAHEANGQILSFITTGGLDAGPDRSTALSHVLYRYDPSNGTLSIRCEPYVYQVDALQDPGGWRPILSGITGMDLQFYDGRQWLPKWDGGENRELPRAVKIAIAVINERGRDHEFGTTVPIACRSTPQNQTSVPGTPKP
jgi:general secretion pathway protein J